MNFNRILKRVGLPVIDSSRSPAPGAFEPVGLIWHHTAGTGDGVLDIVRNGRQDLSGPLCNLYIRQDGTIHVITHGKANDSGMGSKAALRRVRLNIANRKDAKEHGWADNINGNAYFYDIEAEHVGTHGRYSQKQIRSIILATAAILKAQGWGVNRCIHHRQWSSRKIDMSYRGNLWGPVRRTLRTLKRPLISKGTLRYRQVRILHKRLHRMGIEKALVYNKAGLPRSRFNDNTVKAVKRFQRQHKLHDDGVVGTLTWLHLFRQEFRSN